MALVAPLRPGEPAPVVYLGTLPVEKMRGKLLTVNGFWQRQGLLMTPEKLPVFTYTLLGNDGRPGSPPQWSRGVMTLSTPSPGPNWTAFALTIPVPNDEFLARISLGLRFSDPAPLRLDNVQFRLDGRPYVPAPPATAAAPTALEVAWLRKALRPLALTKSPPGAPGLDLAALGPLIGGARVVGLGEVTHGSGSIFQMKHRVVSYLVEHKGFTGLILETSADCGPLDNYLQTGQGDPQGLLAQLGVWNTQEVLDLLRSLRGHNSNQADKVHLAGMDMQRPDLVLLRLQQATPTDDDFAQARLREVAALLAQLPASGGGLAFDLFQHPNQPDDPRLQALLRLVSELRTGLDTRFKIVHAPEGSPGKQATYRHDLRLLEQGIIFRRLPVSQAGDYRDACMAENVEWQGQHLGHNGGPVKLAVWAHNAHIATSAPYQHPLGEWLKTAFGDSYLALGFAFGQGVYAAEGSGKFYVARAQPARPGTYEAWFQAAGPAAFVLDMRPLQPGNGGKWLFQQQLFRDIGTQEASRDFGMHLLRSEFDAVLFMRNSTAAQRL